MNPFACLQYLFSDKVECFVLKKKLTLLHITLSYSFLKRLSISLPLISSSFLKRASSFSVFTEDNCIVLSYMGPLSNHTLYLQDRQSSWILRQKYQVSPRFSTSRNLALQFYGAQTRDQCEAWPWTLDLSPTAWWRGQPCQELTCAFWFRIQTVSPHRMSLRLSIIKEEGVTYASQLVSTFPCC